MVARVVISRLEWESWAGTFRGVGGGVVESHHAGGERPTGLESLKASPGASVPEMATASAVTQRQLGVAGWYRGMALQGCRPGKPPGSCKAPGSAQRCRRQVQRYRG